MTNGGEPPPVKTDHHDKYANSLKKQNLVTNTITKHLFVHHHRREQILGKKVLLSIPVPLNFKHLNPSPKKITHDESPVKSHRYKREQSLGQKVLLSISGPLIKAPRKQPPMTAMLSNLLPPQNKSSPSIGKRIIHDIWFPETIKDFSKTSPLIGFLEPNSPHLALSPPPSIPRPLTPIAEDGYNNKTKHSPPWPTPSPSPQYNLASTPSTCAKAKMSESENITKAFDKAFQEAITKIPLIVASAQKENSRTADRQIGTHK